MDYLHDDTELRRWIRWAEEGRNNLPVFVRTVADAALKACMPDYALLRPVLAELKRQHPEPDPGPAALGDPRAPRLTSLGPRGRQRAVPRWQSRGSSHLRLRGEQGENLHLAQRLLRALVR
ncbi:MAG: hypothetical protein ABSA97_15230 [Verrucomicrobiia bacterium]|jgi:hypothetical protein